MALQFFSSKNPSILVTVAAILREVMQSVLHCLQIPWVRHLDRASGDCVFLPHHVWELGWEDLKAAAAIAAGDGSL